MDGEPSGISPARMKAEEDVHVSPARSLSHAGPSGTGVDSGAISASQPSSSSSVSMPAPPQDVSGLSSINGKNTCPSLSIAFLITLLSDERSTPSRPSIMAIEDKSYQSSPKPSALTTIRSIRKMATAQRPVSPAVSTQAQPEGLDFPNISFSQSTETFSPKTVPLSGSRDISPTVLKPPGPIASTQPPSNTVSPPIASNNGSSSTTVGISFLPEGVHHPHASGPSSATTGTSENAPFYISFLRAPAPNSEVNHNAANSPTLPLKEGSADAAEQKVRVRFLKSSYHVPDK